MAGPMLPSGVVRPLTKRLRESLLLGTAIVAGGFAGTPKASAQTTGAGLFAFPTFCYQNAAGGGAPFQLTCGAGSSATGANSTAYGQRAISNASNSTAIGEASSAQGANSTALGQNAQATKTFSTAIGQNA